MALGNDALSHAVGPLSSFVRVAAGAAQKAITVEIAFAAGAVGHRAGVAVFVDALGVADFCVARKSPWIFVVAVVATTSHGECPVAVFVRRCPFGAAAVRALFAALPPRTTSAFARAQHMDTALGVDFRTARNTALSAVAKEAVVALGVALTQLVPL